MRADVAFVEHGCICECSKFSGNVTVINRMTFSRSQARLVEEFVSSQGQVNMF